MPVESTSRFTSRAGSACSGKPKPKRALFRVLTKSHQNTNALSTLALITHPPTRPLTLPPPRTYIRPRIHALNHSHHSHTHTPTHPHTIRSSCSLMAMQLVHIFATWLNPVLGKGFKGHTYHIHPVGAGVTRHASHVTSRVARHASHVTSRHVTSRHSTSLHSAPRLASFRSVSCRHLAGMNGRCRC